MTVDVRCIYSSSACNKTSNAVDWSSENVVCYSACNAIHLYEYNKLCGGKLIATLLGHKKTVTSVHWIRRPNLGCENELLATSADHTATIWTIEHSQYKLTSTLAGHTNVVRNGTGMYLSSGEGDLMLVTLSVDSSVRIWIRKRDDEVICSQNISLGNGFGLDVKLSTLNSSNEVAMILATDDAKLHIYVQNEQRLFIPTVKLAGHEDWIQSIDILKLDQDAMTIATASQDSYIRIWKVAPFTASEDSSNLKVDGITFNTFLGQKFSVSLESVLSGHENWVYSVKWRHCENTSLTQLLSASMDKTIIIWELDSSSNIWLEKVRFGEVGGNTLGFYGAQFSPCGEIITAHGHQGAIHFWCYDEVTNTWTPGLSFGGHSSPVGDMDWDPAGEYLLSCSSDQTTRLHAPYVKGQSHPNWFEIARPQIHGYDMVCLSLLDQFKFVSAGDEKVLRVFEAPRNFAESLEHLTNIDVSEYLKNSMAEGASVPSLGLSNKAVFQEDILKANAVEAEDLEKHPKDRYPDFYFTPTHLTAPPTEETLLQNTLWPETQKLYGHPYEVFTVATNHSGSLVASACKASKVEHAGIILWDTSTWRQVSYLSFHTLTVTQMEFSPDDKYLLSVSRDRMWALYQYNADDPSIYQKVANLDRKSGVHSRIIWSCSWSFDSLFFTTSSRDKKVAVWGKSTDDAFPVSLIHQPLEVEDSATAVCFAPQLVNNKYFIAIGLENGCIVLSSWCPVEGWNVLQTLNQITAHHLNVNRIKFSPTHGEAGSKAKRTDVLQMASCSNDHHTKIYNIIIQ